MIVSHVQRGVLKPELYVRNESSIFDDMRRFIRLAHHFTSFTMTGIQSPTPLFMLEQLLLKHPHITHLELKGAFSDPYVLKRAAAIAVKCEGVRKIVISYTPCSQTPSVNTMWCWTEALRSNPHLESVHFDSVLMVPNTIVLFAYYLATYTTYKLCQTGREALEIVPSLGQHPPKPKSFFEQLVRVNGIPFLNDFNFTSIKKFNGTQNDFLKYCSKFFAKMQASIEIPTIMQMILTFEAQTGFTLGSFNFISSSGKSFPVSKFAYERFCAKPLNETSVDLSLFSDQAVRQFSYWVNHGGDFWDISGVHFAELLALAIEFKASSCIRALYQIFLKRYPDFFTEISFNHLHDSKARFISSHSPKQEDLLIENALNFDLEGFISFILYLNSKAIEPLLVGKFYTLKITRQHPHINLRKALEFASINLPIRTLAFKWNGFLDIDWNHIDEALKIRKIPRVLEITLDSTLSTHSPLFSFLASSNQTRLLSLACSNKVELLVKEKISKNAIRIATEIVRTHPSLMMIKLNQPYFPGPELERFGHALSASKTLKKVELFANGSLYQEFNAYETTKIDWIPFLDALGQSINLENLLIKHPLNLGQRAVQEALVRMLKDTNSLKELDIAVANISVSFVTRLLGTFLYSTLTSPMTLKSVNIHNVSPFPNDQKGEIDRLLCHQSSNIGQMITITYNSTQKRRNF